MKTILCLLCIFCLPALLCLAPAPPQADRASQDEAAIKQTVLDYLEGWYEGNAERMERALHPDLMKRRLQVLPNGKDVLSTVSAQAMIEYTRAGMGKGKPIAECGISCTLLDLGQNIASAKSVSVDFIDYIHLARHDGRWVIVNVLWEPAPKK